MATLTFNINKNTKDDIVIVFDLENEVIKPLNLGYTREAVAKLDSIFDNILEAKLQQKFESADAKKIISIFVSSRASAVLPTVAYKSKIITKLQKERIEKFKSFRNIILHNAFGELSIYAKKKPKNLTDFIKEEIKKFILLLREIVNKTDTQTKS